MKPKTVNEVIEKLLKLKQRGYGEHILLVSDDEECNGYHELYGLFNCEEGRPLRFLNEHTNRFETGQTICIS